MEYVTIYTFVGKNGLTGPLHSQLIQGIIVDSVVKVRTLDGLAFIVYTVV